MLNLHFKMILKFKSFYPRISTQDVWKRLLDYTYKIDMAQEEKTYKCREFVNQKAATKDVTATQMPYKLSNHPYF